MPRFPSTSQRLEPIGGSVFERLLPALRARGGDSVLLHIGDSAAEPPWAEHLAPAFREEHPRWFQYCNTQGIAPLREALATALGEDQGLVVGPGEIVVTAGASNALAATCMALLDPGDEVLLPTPAWPFFGGMVRMAGATPVELPFYDRLAGTDVEAALGAALSGRTAALYFNSPNNPSGRVVPGEVVEAVVSFCDRHGLWLISDEAYDGVAFDGRRPRLPATFVGEAAQRVSVFTFSKLYGAAGLRLGWAHCPHPAARAVLQKAMVHQLYSPATAAQHAAVGAVRSRHEWAPGVLAATQGARDRFFDALGLDLERPQGGWFGFFDAGPWLGGRDVAELALQAIDAGVSITPGVDFGRDYARWVRVCFTATPGDRLEEGARRLRRVLEAR